MSIKSKLKNNELTIGSWITLGHPSIAEIMASANFDWMVIDLEHSVIELTDTQNIIRTLKANGLAALVRVSKNEEVIIKRVLDAGADGVLIPMVNTKKDAQAAVSFVRYPPLGHRGVGLARAQHYGVGFENYVKWLKDEVIIIAQIEHIEGVNNLKEIISVDGIDGVIVGPYDLSGSLGFPGDFNNKKVKSALEQIKVICKTNKIPLGYHIIKPDHKELQSKIKEGYNFIGFSLDFYFLGEKLRDEMKLAKIKK